ncbi:MAG: hypothetical protein KKD77_23180, partial [Gammaproteobacteria bacterium]|nr:hypothetical protein [Gammaproteobacteria bacterium]
MDECQHRWQLVQDNEHDSNLWWIKCEECDEYGTHEDVNNFIRDLRGALHECELDRAQDDKMVKALYEEYEMKISALLDVCEETVDYLQHHHSDLSYFSWPTPMEKELQAVIENKIGRAH